MRSCDSCRETEDGARYPAYDGASSDQLPNLAKETTLYISRILRLKQLQVTSLLWTFGWKITKAKLSQGMKDERSGKWRETNLD